MTPAGRLAASLRYAWSSDEAQVLADWCEEHQLIGLARMLRKGPSIRIRIAIENLALMLGCHAADPDTLSKTFDDWAAGYKNLHMKRRRGAHLQRDLLEYAPKGLIREQRRTSQRLAAIEARQRGTT